jgi:hypothetical protein
MGKRKRYDSGNAKNCYQTTVRAVMNAPGFATGFGEVLRGKPADFDKWSTCKAKAWAYERGRLFGVVFKGKLKDGNRITRDAIFAFADAYKSKSLT